MCVRVRVGVFTLKRAKVLTQYAASSTVSSTETCMRPYVSVPRLGQYWSHLFCTQSNGLPLTPRAGVPRRQEAALLHHAPHKDRANYQELSLNYGDFFFFYFIQLWKFCNPIHKHCFLFLQFLVAHIPLGHVSGACYTYRLYLWERAKRLSLVLAYLIFWPVNEALF